MEIAVAEGEEAAVAALVQTGAATLQATSSAAIRAQPAAATVFAEVLADEEFAVAVCTVVAA